MTGSYRRFFVKEHGAEYALGDLRDRLGDALKLEYQIGSDKRFVKKAYGAQNYYLACDLDEGTLMLWENAFDYDYWPLVGSSDLDEKTLWRHIKEDQAEGKHAIGVFLSQEDIDHLEALLSPENIETWLGISEAYMEQKTADKAFEDDWSIDFYAEGDNGSPPLSIKDILHIPRLLGTIMPLYEIIDYVHREVLHDDEERLGYNVTGNQQW